MPIKRRQTRLTQMVKQDVLTRAMGCCERCGSELGDTFYFRYKGYRLDIPDCIRVICSKCERQIRSVNRRIR